MGLYLAFFRAGEGGEGVFTVYTVVILHSVIGQAESNDRIYDRTCSSDLTGHSLYTVTCQYYQGSVGYHTCWPYSLRSHKYIQTYAYIPYIRHNVNTLSTGRINRISLSIHGTMIWLFNGWIMHADCIQRLSIGQWPCGKVAGRAGSVVTKVGVPLLFFSHYYTCLKPGTFCISGERSNY